MAYELTNLSDALWMLQSQEFNNFSPIDMDKAFSQANCPLAWKYGDWRKVPTWEDFAKILGGDPGAKTGTNCLRTASNPGSQRWGETFGKWRGPGGMPIARSRPLDTSFFEYLGSPGHPINLASAFSRVVSAATPDIWSREAGSWTANHAESGVLDPGAYWLVSCAHNGYTAASGVETGWVIDNQEPICVASCSARGIWHAVNSIIFVDSPVEYSRRMSAARDASAHLMGVVFRLSPRGSWMG